MVDTTEARQVCRAVKLLLYSRLDFGIMPNGTYPSEDSGEVLTRNAFEREFTNTSARHVQLTRGEEIDLEDGMEVVLDGNIDFWVEGGKISLKPGR